MALYDFANQYVLPILQELAKVASDLNDVGLASSVLGTIALANPLTTPLAFDLFSLEAEILASGSVKSLGAFSIASKLVPLQDPPITLPTVTPQGLVTSSILADFDALLLGEAQLVSDGSNLAGLVQELRTALTNSDYVTASSLVPQIQAALTALSALSQTQGDLYAALFKEIVDSGIPDLTFTAGDFSAFLANLESVGFPPQEIALFEEMGFTQADINDILSQALGTSFNSVPDSVYLLLSEASTDHVDIAQITGATVPEPGTLILLGGALLLCFGLVWRTDCSLAE